jgi:tryptophan synthase alpha chain
MTVGSVQTGTARIAAAFTDRTGRAALMPYMMGGFPDPATTTAVAGAYRDGGADLIEFGLPFSDPLADGPVIHQAATTALGAGAATTQLLEEIAPVAAQLPMLAMTYFNIIEVRGVESFLDLAAAAGICGLIIPDLPFDEADQMLELCDQRGLALIQLVAPTTTDDRMAAICGRARGFIYVVSYTGTTGTGQAAGDELTGLIARVRANTDLPVAVGFGIATPDDAARVAELADGVIVGTALVKAVGDAAAGGVDVAGAARERVAALRAALD